MAEILQNEGFILFAARDGQEALQVLDTMPALPDVVILDLMMPGLDGAGFLAEARLARAGFSNVPVVVTSAAGPHGELLVPPEAVSAWLAKPIELEELTAVLQTVSGEKKDAERPLRRKLLAFLSRRGVDLEELRQALASEDYESVEGIGQRLTLSGQGFGFPSLSEVGRAISKAAQARNREAAAAAVRRLADVLLGLQTAS